MQTKICGFSIFPPKLLPPEGAFLCSYILPPSFFQLTVELLPKSNLKLDFQHKLSRRKENKLKIPAPFVRRLISQRDPR
jgi:hypothetical protein